MGLGFRSGFRAWGLGLRVQSFRCRVEGLGLRIRDSGFRV